MAGDFPNIAVLKYLEPGPQTDDDAAPDILAGLLEDAVGGFSRVGDGQHIKKGIQLLLTALRQ
jgi:hypothetical protein